MSLPSFKPKGSMTPLEAAFTVAAVAGLMAVLPVMYKLDAVQAAEKTQELENVIDKYQVERVAVPQDLYKLEDGNYRLKVEDKDCTAFVHKGYRTVTSVQLNCH